MERRKLSGIVTRKSEVAGKPEHSVRLTCGEVWVFRKMQEAGRRGVTTRDFLGADLRHYIRNFKEKGIGYEWRWENDAFSHHKRWWLKDGQNFEDTSPKKPKPQSARTVEASNPNPIGENGGLLDA